MYLTVQIVEHMDNQRMYGTVFIDFKKEDLKKDLRLFVAVVKKL